VSKKSILIRIDPQLWMALDKWAADEFRSLNGQVEYLLDCALREAGRKPASNSRNQKPFSRQKPSQP
jgi:hypothetical protein